jgi:hypothetical protein
MKGHKFKLAHIHKDHLSQGIQDAIDNYGFTVYKGVLIVWSSGDDKKVMKVVDQVSNKYPEKLLIVHLDRNVLEMLWKGDVPKGFQSNLITGIVGGHLTVLSDSWLIPVL